MRGSAFGYRLSVRERILFALLADLHVLPAWLPDALEVSLREDPNGLLQSVGVTNLTGRLLRVLQDTGLECVAPRQMLDALTAYRAESELVLAAYTKHAYELASVAGAIGIEVCLLKGLHLAHTIYDNSFEREVQDIDVLTSPESALMLFRLAEELGYQTGAFNRTNYEFSPQPLTVEVNNRDGHYELPRQWLIFDIQLEPEDVALLRLGPMSRSRLIGKTLLRIPVSLEVHYRLTSSIKAPRKTVLFHLGDGNSLIGLSSTDNIIYLCHKALIDLIIFKERKSAKLIADIFRILLRERELIESDLLLSLADEYDLLAVVGNFISAAQAFHETDQFDDILARIANHIRSKKAESWDMADPLFALLERPVSPLSFN